MPSSCINDGGILDDDIQCLVGIAHAGVDALTVAQRLSRTDHQFMARDGVVVLDFGQQAGVTQPDEVALGGTIEFGVGPTTDGHHRLCSAISATLRPHQCRIAGTGRVQGTVHQSRLAYYHAQALDRHEADKLGDTRLKPDPGAGWHV